MCTDTKRVHHHYKCEQKKCSDINVHRKVYWHKCEQKKCTDINVNRKSVLTQIDFTKYWKHLLPADLALQIHILLQSALICIQVCHLCQLWFTFWMSYVESAIFKSKVYNNVQLAEHSGPQPSLVGYQSHNMLIGWHNNRRGRAASCTVFDIYDI